MWYYTFARLRRLALAKRTCATWSRSNVRERVIHLSFLVCVYAVIRQSMQTKSAGHSPVPSASLLWRSVVLRHCRFLDLEKGACDFVQSVGLFYKNIPYRVLCALRGSVKSQVGPKRKARGIPAPQLSVKPLTGPVVFSLAGRISAVKSDGNTATRPRNLQEYSVLTSRNKPRSVRAGR